MSDHVIIAVAFAFLMMLTLGSPSWFPHPGRFISWTARRLYPPFRRGTSPVRLRGALYIASMSLGGMILVGALLEGVALISYDAFLILSVLLIYTALLPTNFFQQSEQVRAMLERGDRPGARRHLSAIVGVDVGELKDDEASRMTIETTAEKAVTEIVSPLFFALIGGPAFAIAYRALTVSHEVVQRREPPYGPFVSMTESLLYILDFVPSRVVLLLTIFAAWYNRYNVARCWLCVQRDGGIHLNPNVGLVKAAYAGTLGIQLAGTNFFYGGTSTMPPIGEPTKDVEPADIRHGLNLLLTTSVAAFFCGVAARVIVLSLFSLIFQSCRTEPVHVVIPPTAEEMESIDVTGTWTGTWESTKIAGAKGTFDCVIGKEGGEWKLTGTLSAAEGATRNVELRGKPEKDLIRFAGTSDFGANGKYVWEILASRDGIKGTFTSDTDAGSCVLRKN